MIYNNMLAIETEATLTEEKMKEIGEVGIAHEMPNMCRNS